MTLKTCKICGQEKANTFFSVNRSRPDGLHYNCKPCDSKKSRQWYAENTERDSIRKAKYRKDNLEACLQADRNRYYNDKANILFQRKEHYSENKEVIIKRVKIWSSKNRDKRRLYLRKHYSRNKPEYVARCAMYRASKMNATPPWLTPIHMAQIQEMYDVAFAKSVQTGVKHHVDHIHPLQGDNFSGLHVPWNLQVIEAFENLSKGNRLPVDDFCSGWSSQSPATVATPSRG